MRTGHGDRAARAKREENAASPGAKKHGDPKRRGTAAALLVIALTAALLYVAGGLWEYRPGGEDAAAIADNVAAITALAQAEPVDLAAEARARRIALIRARGGVMVDDIESARQAVLSEDPPDKATLQRWFANAAVAGDSIVEDIIEYGCLRSPVFAELGVRASAELDLLDDVEAAAPQVVFLSFGVNDIKTYRRNVRTFYERYKAMVERLCASLPDAAIYVCAVFPASRRATEEMDYYRYLSQYNAALQKVCEETGAFYVDSAFLLEARPDLFSGDGIHFNHKFYPLWLRWLADLSGLSNEDE